jgi:hypothetical protein
MSCSNAAAVSVVRRIGVTDLRVGLIVRHSLRGLQIRARDQLQEAHTAVSIHLSVRLVLVIPLNQQIPLQINTLQQVLGRPPLPGGEAAGWNVPGEQPQTANTRGYSLASDRSLEQDVEAWIEGADAVVSAPTNRCLYVGAPYLRAHFAPDVGFREPRPPQRCIETQRVNTDRKMTGRAQWYPTSDQKRADPGAAFPQEEPHFATLASTE